MIEKSNFSEPPTADTTPETLTDLTADTTPETLTDLTAKNNSFLKKITDLKKAIETKNNFQIPASYLEIKELGENELFEIRKHIHTGFIKKLLHKGATEVYNAIYYTVPEPFQKVYIVGYLDLTFEKALLTALAETKKDIPVVRLDKKYLSLVHECIKDINRDDTTKPKNPPRRAFKCRLFIA